MKKVITYFWLIVFICTLNSAFGMNPTFHSNQMEQNSEQMTCCCSHDGAEACAKPCCSENQNNEDENDCQGKCGNSSTQCSSISLNIVALPNSNIACISEFIEYTFQTPIDDYLEALPQPIDMPIWQPPKLG